MSKNITLAAIFLLAFGLLISCSSGDGDITAPSTGGQKVSAESSSHMLWGLWQFTADPANGTLDVTPIRMAEMHLNALPFLEPPPLVNLTLESLEFNGNIIEADIGLRHPFLGMSEFTGFDVCGILITNGGCDGFADSNINYAGPGDTRLLNPDGHSRWWNPSEFPIGKSMFNYVDGFLGTPDSHANYNSTINGCKYFCDDLDNPGDPMTDVTLPMRGMFSAGKKNIRHYSIFLGSEGLVFNYAVDASWEFPEGSFPWEIPDDFGENANRIEPWWIDVHENTNTLYYYGGSGGGGLNLTIDVYDWYKAEQNVLYIEAANGVAPQVGPISPTGGGEGYSTYEVDITGVSPTAIGDLDFLITVETEGEGFQGFIPGTNTSAYRIYTTTVTDCQPPVITGIDPNAGWTGQEIHASIYGTFADGPMLAARLEKTGESDIVATDVVFVDTGEITCVINLTSAADGDWTVVVTTGCGAEGYLPDGFTVGSCAEYSACPPGPFTYVNHFVSFIHYPHYGTDATRASDPQYLICTGFKNTIEHRIIAYIPGNTTYSYLSAIMGPYISSGELPRTLACDSNDRVYYRAGDTPNWLQYIDFTTGTGFGPIDQMFGIQIPWGSIRRVAVDMDDNPVILCHSGTSLRIYTWTGSDWGTPINVSSQVMSDNGNTYANINDFEINPVTGDYLITTYFNPPKFYAIDSDGDIVYSDDDIWDTGVGEKLYCGIYVDVDNPGCRFILNGAPYIELNGPHFGETHFARCNPVYGEWTFSTTAEGNYPFADGLGSVVDVNGTPYFCGTSSYRWYSTYIEITEW